MNPYQTISFLNRRNEIVSKFNELDINHTGKIDRKTMGEILRYEACEFERLMVVLLFEKYDINKDGWIDFNEFLSFCLSTDRLSSEIILRQIFDISDLDHDGYLDVDEVKRLGEQMGIKVDMNDAWATVAALDKNNDNRIDYNEFRAIIVN